jgi:hypothetical protein
MSAADKNVNGRQKCQRQTKMSTADKNVNGTQKCQRQTKMPTADKNAHGSALISFVSLNNS